MTYKKEIGILKYLLNFKWFYKFLPEKLALIIFIYLVSPQAVSSEMKSSNHLGDTIIFSGYKWLVKESGGRQIGPGNNYFSGSKENIFVDSEGKLHLKITNRNDIWYCPEVKLVNNLGRGKYLYYLDPLPQPMDKDVVIGLFLYDREDTSNFHKEVDIEISQWGKDTLVNSQYVIQPKEEEAYRFRTDLGVATKHMIEIKKSRVVFKSYYGTPDSSDIPLEYAGHGVKPEYDFYSPSERICMNVWLYHTSEPASLKPFEVVISHFEYQPFWYDKFLKFFRKDKKE
jgi:hypothetical protein